MNKCNPFEGITSKLGAKDCNCMPVSSRSVVRMIVTARKGENPTDPNQSYKIGPWLLALLDLVNPDNKVARKDSDSRNINIRNCFGD